MSIIHVADQESESSGDSPGVIIGIICACLVIALVAIIGVAIIWKVKCTQLKVHTYTCICVCFLFPFTD